jgi:hypothetical protein
MFPNVTRAQPRWMDQLRLHYWRQVIRLTRYARQLKAWLVPIQHLLWLPLVVGLAGVMVGFLFAVL